MTDIQDVNRDVRAAPEPAQRAWRASMLLAAPHRLGFFCAMSVLIAGSLWWLAVQADRASAGALALPFTLSPTVVHGTVMVFGFMPLFFCGFLFTAGPKWLDVPPYTPHQLLAPLALQAGGWWLWLAGSLWSRSLALFGMLAALLGLAWVFGLFWRLIVMSSRPERKHALTIGSAGIVGVAALAACLASLLAGQDALELVFVRTALWGFIVIVFSTVAHRMIPFFTHGVVPRIELWRPYWILGLMVGVAAFEVLAVWVDWAAPSPHAWPAWSWLAIAVETAAGLVLLWLVVAWGLLPSLKIRLLGMLHIGFTWYGLALLYSALSQFLWLRSGQAVLGVGALHALSMGFLGSLMLAMVTRVTCGHSGRPLVADNLVWGLFLALQLSVLVRLLAAIQNVPLIWTLLAALLWGGIMTLWGFRYINWYGRPRTDGRPG